jgi:hypothetical protein
MHIEGERVEVVPISEGNKIAPFGVVAAALAPRIIDFTASRLEEFYERESEKYRASYSGKYVGDDFYKSANSLELSYDKIEVRRYVSIRSKGAPEETLASSIILGFRTNRDGTLLTMQPIQLVVHKTKAKLKAGDTNVDITLNFRMDGYWKNKAQDIKSKETADISLILKNIELGEIYTLQKDENNQTYLKDASGKKSNYNVMSEWFAPVPFSLDDKDSRSEGARGNFVMTVVVTELDDYGQQDARFGENINDSSPIWEELARKLLN